MWGPHNIDGFANHKNRKTKRFNSVVWNPECEQVDVISVNWAGENNWLVPRIYLVPKVLRHVVQCKAWGLLSYLTGDQLHSGHCCLAKTAFVRISFLIFWIFQETRIFTFKVEIKTRHSVPKNLKVMF